MMVTYEELLYDCSMNVGDLIVMRPNAWEGTNFPGEIKGLIVGISGALGKYSDYTVLWVDGKIEADLVGDYLEMYYVIYSVSCIEYAYELEL